MFWVVFKGFVKYIVFNLSLREIVTLTAAGEFNTMERSYLLHVAVLN